MPLGTAESKAGSTAGDRAHSPAAALIPNLRHTERMLRDLGMDSIDRLFDDIPSDVQVGGLKLAAPMSESAMLDHVAMLANQNQHPKLGGGGMPVFLGAGLKEHYVPAPVRALVGRSEFYTSYTPYQPEASQGMLQALFEFQSIVTELTQMDVANVSMYDWATALGEAGIMAARAHDGKRFLVPAALTPEKRAVLENYLLGAKIEVEAIPYDRATGTLDLAALDSMLGADVCGVYVENPNLFGLFESEAPRLKSMMDDKEAGLLVVGTDPVSLGIVQGPGAYGADITIGELGGIGTGPSFGGPLVGLFATTSRLVRKMPGRIVGLTHDHDNRTGFTLTLQAREQHIRRERAMSNICTNQTLAAVASTVWFSLIGGRGLTQLAQTNMQRADRLKKRLAEIPGVALAFDGATFDEFTLRFDQSNERVHTGLLARGVHGGYDLTPVAPELGDAAVYCTTEVHNDHDHDRLVAAMKEVFA